MYSASSRDKCEPRSDVRFDAAPARRAHDPTHLSGIVRPGTSPPRGPDRATARTDRPDGGAGFGAPPKGPLVPPSTSNGSRERQKHRHRRGGDLATAPAPAQRRVSMKSRWPTAEK